MKRLLLAALALAALGGRARAFWPFGESSDGKILPIQALNDAGKPAAVLARLTPQFLQTLRGTDLRRAYVLLGDSLDALDRPDQALANYQIGLSLFSKDVVLLTREGALLHRSGLDEHARDLFQLALKYQPKDAVAHMGLAEIERSLGFLDRAAEHYRVALETLGRHAEVWRSYSEVLLEQGEPWAADVALRKSLELEPRNASSHVLLAFMQRAQGDLPEALLQLDVAEGLGAGAGAARAKALWLLEAGRLSDARETADRLLRKSPGDAAALWTRARVRLAAGDLGGADADLAAIKDADGDFVARSTHALRDVIAGLKARRIEGVSRR